MNTNNQSEEQLERATQVQCGYSAEEIGALLWLRQWYQTGSSDRVQMMRHLEFFKFLVSSGKLEL
jgi:hypothetical protein